LSQSKQSGKLSEQKKRIWYSMRLFGSGQGRHLTLLIAVAFVVGTALLAGCGGGGGGGGSVTGTTGGSGGAGGSGSLGTVTGRVVGINTPPAPMQGVTVTISGVTATSDSTGHFTVRNVPVGTFSLKFNVSGIVSDPPTPVSVTVQANVTTNVGDVVYENVPPIPLP
jgi:hypothetical protein